MIARLLYTALATVALPLVLGRLLWRGIRNRGYWFRWGERFGRFAAPAAGGAIWIHAVSVGEVQAVAPLVRRLLAAGHALVLTTTTPTGSQRVRALFGERVFHVYLPFDLPPAVAGFLDRVRPALAVVVETELWPNLFHACARRAIPLLLVNARLSPRSAAGYRRIRPLVAQTLGCLSALAARSSADAERFLALGAPAGRVVVAGNIKYDLELPASLAEQGQALRALWGAGRPVWVAGSTHEGEEAAVLAAFAQVRRAYADCLLALVPRHPERFDRVAALCREAGWRTARRGCGEAAGPDCDVVLVDTLGELTLFYAGADLAFVGGSLVPVGGHNVLEAAALGVPVVTGPHLFNFVGEARALAQRRALVTVDGPQGLAGAVVELLGDPERRERMAADGRALVAENRGAVARITTLLEHHLGGRGP